MGRYEAERFELEVEHNSIYDYHSELWASEIESMKDEGEMNQAAEDDAEFDRIDWSDREKARGIYVDALMRGEPHRVALRIAECEVVQYMKMGSLEDLI